MPPQVFDPDFGEIEAPPPPSREEYEKAAREVQQAFSATRLWPPGSTGECPQCGKHSFVGRNDLTHRIAKPDAVLVFRHLRGAHCEVCGAQSLEPAALMAIEREADDPEDEE